MSFLLGAGLLLFLAIVLRDAKMPSRCDLACGLGAFVGFVVGVAFCMLIPFVGGF